METETAAIRSAGSQVRQVKEVLIQASAHIDNLLLHAEEAQVRLEMNSRMKN